MPADPVRTLDVPAHGSRAWRIPSMLYWDRQRLKRLDAQHELYAEASDYKRRRRSLERRIARLEAEFRDLHEGKTE